MIKIALATLCNGASSMSGTLKGGSPSGWPVPGKPSSKALIIGKLILDIAMAERTIGISKGLFLESKGKDVKL